MKDKVINKQTSALKGQVTVPGDKSVSHRSIMLGAIAIGRTEITHFLQGEDCLATIDCFRRMGISIEANQQQVTVIGKGLTGLHKPADTLYVGNSGTTTRLMSGILAGQSFSAVLSGDESLNSRPMKRIMEPLSQMGCHFESHLQPNCAPFTITGGSLSGIDYMSPVASAQVKSAVLFAGLYADGRTSVTEPVLSRNHTELMLQGFGADLCCHRLENGQAFASVTPGSLLYGQKINVPGDISSAAYFIAAAMIVPGSEVLIRQVGINETRAGMLSVCRQMGGSITLLNETTQGGEPTADLLVRASSLHGTVIEGSLIPTLIDEIPVLAVLAAFADGTTVIRDASELKVKETNRIQTVTENLLAMGATVTPTEDGMIIEGGSPLHGAHINSYLDHRIAMAFAVAGLASDGQTKIQDSHCIDVSYPAFFESLGSLCQ